MATLGKSREQPKGANKERSCAGLVCWGMPMHGTRGSLPLAACLVWSVGCGDFFEELPLGEPAQESTGSTGSISGDPTGTQPELDCEHALSACRSQDEVLACAGEPRQPRSETCAQQCASLTPVTCWRQLDGSAHGCWCERTGKIERLGCAGLSNCVARCGGPQGDGQCIERCFAQTLPQTARIYGALVFCAQDQCETLCGNQPAQCGRCIDQTMSGTLGGCVALSATCGQDKVSEIDPLSTP